MMKLEVAVICIYKFIEAIISVDFSLEILAGATYR